MCLFVGLGFMSEDPGFRAILLDRNVFEVSFYRGPLFIQPDNQTEIMRPHETSVLGSSCTLRSESRMNPEEPKLETSCILQGF